MAFQRHDAYMENFYSSTDEDEPTEEDAFSTSPKSPLKVDGVWQKWVLIAGVKKQNEWIREHNLTDLEAKDLKETTRREKKKGYADKRRVRAPGSYKFCSDSVCFGLIELDLNWVGLI